MTKTTLWEELDPWINDALECHYIFELRDKFTKKYSWAVPSLLAIEYVKTFAGSDGIVEINAGKGLWAKLLQDEGVDVVPTDLHSEGDTIGPGNHYWKEATVEDKRNFTYVGQYEATEAVNKYVDHNVLMTVWPSYDQDYAYKALKEFKGNKLIYVGEGYEGCTACEDFHKELEANWEEVDCIDIPRWWGLHDRMYLYTRKGA